MAVYFIECNGKVKIGFSQDPEKRSSAIQTGNPEKVNLIGVIEEFGRDEEKLLHSMLEKYHYRGEWYHLTTEVRKIIKQMASENIVEKEVQVFASDKYEVITMGEIFFCTEFSMKYEDYIKTSASAFILDKTPTLHSIEKCFASAGFEGEFNIRVFYMSPLFIEDANEHGEVLFFDICNGDELFLLVDKKYRRGINHPFSRLKNRKRIEDFRFRDVIVELKDLSKTSRAYGHQYDDEKGM